MKNNTFYYKLAISILLVLLTSCTDQFVKGVYIGSNNEYSLNAETSSLQSIPAEGGAIAMQIEASNMVNWEIQDLPYWISASTLSGTGKQEIIFNVEPNESLTSSRSQIFNIVSMNSDWLVTIPVLASQSKKNTFLTLSPVDNSSWTFDSEGGFKELNISSNLEWTAECQNDFVTLSRNSGNGNSTIIISVAPYTHIDVTTNRTASIYFKTTLNEEVMQVLTVTQTPLQTSVETETINVEFQRLPGSRSFALGEVQGEYSVKSDAPWLNISKNDDRRVDVTLYALENENDAERFTNAYVYLDNTNTVKYLFAVKQQGNALTIETDNITFDSNGGIYNIKVDSNTKWKTTNTHDWINVEEDDNSCTISVPMNNSLDSRSGEILFNKINTGGEIIGKSVTLQVNQKGKTLSLDNEILQFGPGSSTQSLNIESDARWTLTAVNDWIHLSMSEGFGNNTVSVSVDENNTTSNRLGSLKLECLGKTFEITIIQESTYVNTSSTSIEIPSVGGSANVTLTSNVEWTATSSETWLTVTPQSGNGETTLELSALYNETTITRTAVVTISSKAGDIKINVSQEAPSVSVSQSFVQFDYTGGTSSPIVITADGNYNISPSDSWISYDQTDNTITLKVEKNESINSREGNVKISLEKAPVSTTITIKQTGEPETVVNLLSAYQITKGIKVTAEVISSIPLKEVGLVYKRYWTYPEDTPTIHNYYLRYSTENFKGGEFTDEVGRLSNEPYGKVRAYAIDINGKVYYSDAKVIQYQ